MRAPSRLTHAQLEIALEVARCGSFSEAALELQLTQSAVSQSVATLERALGVPLFQRGRQGARLSHQGAALLEVIQRAHSALEQLQQRALEDRPLSGRVRVVAFRSAAELLLAPLSAHLRHLYPELQLDISSHEEGPGWTVQALRDGRADIGIGALPMPGVQCWPLGQDHFVAVTAGKGPVGAIGWAELSNRPLLLCGVDCTAPVMHYWAQHGQTPDTGAPVREDSVVLALVAAGAGVALLPRLALGLEPRGVRLRRLPAPLTRRIGVAVRPGAQALPAVAAVLDTLQDPQALAGLEVVRQGLLTLHPSFRTPAGT